MLAAGLAGLVALIAFIIKGISNKENSIAVEALEEVLNNEANKKKDEAIDNAKEDHASAVNSNNDDWIDGWINRPKPGGAVPNIEGRIDRAKDSS